MGRMWMAAVAVGALLLTGCAAAPATTPGKLFREYTRNTHVKNDVFPGMQTPADRLANLAAQGPPQAVEASLLGAYPCADRQTCRPDDTVLAAMRTVIGPHTKTRYKTGIDRLYQRLILVKRGSGQMELISTYVAKTPAGSPRLIDDTGRTYRDLEDFQRDNQVLGSGDLILTLADITSVPGKGRIVAVPGHTTASPWPWIGGTVAVLAVLGAGAGVVVRRRQPKRPEM